MVNYEIEQTKPPAKEEKTESDYLDIPVICRATPVNPMQHIVDKYTPRKTDHRRFVRRMFIGIGVFFALVLVFGTG